MRMLLMFLFCALGACASVSTIPLSKDTFQITSNATGGCGMDGAQKVAFQQAAVETIRRGYDSFVIVGTDRQSEVTSASLYNGSALYGHTYSQDLTVKMYSEGDPAASEAISARESLGPKWAKALNTDSTFSCT